jgi:hypothetical protein
VWRTFAFVVGLLVYCVTAALTRDSSDRVSVLVSGTAIIGVLTAKVMIRRLQTRAYLLLQLAYLLRAVAVRGRAVIDDVYPARPAIDAGTIRPGQCRRCAARGPGPVRQAWSNSSNCVA